LLLNLSNSVYAYLGEWEQPEYQARVAIVMLNYIYYKNANVNEKIRERLPKDKQNDIFCLSQSPGLVDQLVSQIRQFGGPRQRVRATL
jgi:hypothetical protein